MSATADALLSATAEASSEAKALPDAPYRGIESFRYVDRPIFFAREEETRKLLRYVAVYRGVLFYGDSGSGKSSLINAGFIPAITEEGFTPDRLRVQPRPGEEIVIERISKSPDGGAPFLPSNFVRDGETATRVVIPAAELKERIEKRLKEWLRERHRELPAEQFEEQFEMLLKAAHDAPHPVLIFDQFEEFATLFEAAPRGDAVRQAREAQEAILKAVVGLLRAELPVKMLFVFREDYLAKLNKLVALFPDLSDQYLRLTPPTTSVLHKIIRGSFDKFPGKFGQELSEGLTERLGAAIKERSETGRLNLSEVQIACLELWKSDRPEELFEQKGVQGLLEDYLSASLDRLAAGLRDPAVALLDRMVTPSGTRNIVSEHDLISQVSEDERIPQDRLRNALRALVDESRLVRRERRYDTYFYDIVSEFLVPWIMQQKAERLARRERRKKVVAFIIAAVLLLVAGGVAFAAWRVINERTQRAIAEEEVKKAYAAEELARQELSLAREERRRATGERDDALEERDKALEQVRNLERQLTTATNRANDLQVQKDRVQRDLMACLK